MTTRRDILLRTMAAGVATALPLRIAHVAKANTSEDGPRIAHPGEAQTVLGPIDASRLGFTLPHEHVADGLDDLSRWPKARGGRAEFVAKAVEKLKYARTAGVNTIADLTTYDVGRDIRFLEEVSRKSGLNMIACTGQRFFPRISQVSMPAPTIEGLTSSSRKKLNEVLMVLASKQGLSR